MSLTQWDPFRELLSLQERMNRLFDQTFSRSRSQAGEIGGGTWSPAVDLYESQDHLILKAELPGVEQSEIELRVDSNRISLRGERRLKEAINQEHFHRMERAFGPFSRSFTLPTPVDAENVKAEFKNGILMVILPKRVDKDSKHIPISG
jgi:HSP20 family protein